MKAITTFSRALFDSYAHRVIETFENWPDRARLIVYSEDMTADSTDRIEWRDLHQRCPDLVKFKEHCKTVPRPHNGYEFDAARFANKAFAMMDGADAGLCFWLDADCVTYRKIPDGFMESLIPEGHYMGYYGRDKLYTETGFWGARADHRYHKKFMDAWKQVYLDGTVFKLPQWHDCMTLDFTRAHFETWGLMKNENLSAEYFRISHPMARSKLGRYIDHCKGPRKIEGFSPENPWREKMPA